jgi:hypothetical protein
VTNPPPAAPQITGALNTGAAAAVSSEPIPWAEVPRDDTWFHRWFRTRRRGQKAFKWWQYFAPYTRHLAHLRGRNVTMLEIGVQNGGSVDMWQGGPVAHVVAHALALLCCAVQTISGQGCATTALTSTRTYCASRATAAGTRT